ncbi:hypothetical protein AB0O34_32625 [Sphaerisporangium sp. NPDC088356]|uniref:hypothetical protein n=1 Tax=Sphaerisporangium sp. NPDC088356 TaxID=3154871 RepID=UPI0034328B45
MAWLHISEATAQKIQHRHHLIAEEVRDAVVCQEGLVYVWDDHPERGLRALVQVRIRGALTLIVLYPSRDGVDDIYWLGSAYPIE